MSTDAKKLYLFGLLIVLGLQNVQSQGTQLLRQPSLSAEKIVFVYANDLWVVDRSGGDAYRLTSNEGYESNPHFSNDGSMVAFSAQYGGNTDVYVVDANGGSPTRLTYHPGGDFVQGWTSDNKVLFRSGRESHPTETNSFYEIGLDESFPKALNVTRAAYGEMSKDGKYLAYTPITSWDPEWRNYRGGQAMPIWIQDITTGKLTMTPQKDDERHLDPVWLDGKVYYLSERDYLSNIWSYDINTAREKQITFHKVFDVKSIDAFGSDMIYEQGGFLHLIENGSAKQLEINVRGDMNFAMERWENVRANRWQNFNLSPNGKRAILEHRGEIFSVPKKEGSYRNLTNSPGVADRSPIWSPKGDKIAWFTDESGEYELVIADQYGKELKRTKGPSSSFYFTPDWSADGEKIAFTDTHYNIWYYRITSSTFVKVDTDRYAHPNRSMNPVWSPDSRYLAYAKQQESHFKSIFVFDSMTKQVTQITDGLADITDPIFDPSGEYLYYLASTDYGLASGWLDMSSYDPSLTRTLYATLLYKDGKSPLLPKSDEEEKEEDDDTVKEAPSKKKKRSKRKDEEVADPKPAKKAIDFNNIRNRVVPIPAVSGDYFGLAKGPKETIMVMSFDDNGLNVKKYSFEDDELGDYVSGVSRFVSSYDGSHALYLKGSSWNISSLKGKPNAKEDGIQSSLKIKVDPKEEYHQIFKEGWRYMRDFLYVDNLHGAPWDKVWEWYSPWIDHVRHRTDLNYVVDIMSGEVAIGHSYVSGGDMPDLDRVGVGLLGADYELVNGQYQIKKIYTGEHWNPNTRAPLAEIGLDIKVGDYISSVNGIPIDGSRNLYSYFQETNGKHISLGLKSSMASAERTVIVKPISNERGLRTVDWMEENRRKVDELSNGKLAYVWVPNTGGGGFTNFNRYYFSQQDKKGVIIDERNNGGGSAADYMIDVMSRELFGYFNSRANDKRPWTTPMAGIWGPKVMIINERAGSGGDLLPYMFRAKGIGPLIGTRTWGGLVGTWDTPPFIDGGRMVAPRGGFYDVDGKWAVEGDGVAPDIEVIMDPELVLQGIDPQLEAAVEEALRLLEQNTFELKPEPAAPIRSKRPAGWDNN